MSGLVLSPHSSKAQEDGAIVYYTPEYIFYLLPIKLRTCTLLLKIVSIEIIRKQSRPVEL